MHEKTKSLSYRGKKSRWKSNGCGHHIKYLITDCMQKIYHSYAQHCLIMQITNRELQQFLNCCPHLEDINASHCENLKVLNVQNNRSSTGVTRKPHRRGPASIRRLNLGFTELDCGSIAGLLRGSCIHIPLTALYRL